MAKAPADDEDFSRMQRAAAALRPGGFCGRLPCRDAELGELSAHLRAAVRQGGSAQVLYVSGMPGTGKTASVLHAVAALQASKLLPQVAAVHVNAMRLGTPAAVFADICNQLPRGGQARCAAHAAHAELTGLFAQRKPSDPVVLLLIDEIDQLVTRNQAVLYRVFDWLSLPNARLVVVAISNTMDLPERLLPRVASRFGIVRVDFAPYRKDQIAQILMERLGSYTANEAFNPVALKLCAARVAAGSGDIRKALQLCGRAIEVRLSDVKAVGPVDVRHLEVAEKDLIRASPAACAIGGLSLGARRLLTAMLLELRQRGADVVPLQGLVSRYGKLMAAAPGWAGDEALPLAELARVAAAPPRHAQAQAQAEDEVAYLLGRLEAVALLGQQAQAAGLGRVVGLGAGLDAEDLTGALEAAEGDAGVRALLREVGQR